MTPLQPLHPIDDRTSWQVGQVALDPTAVIAPGVLLQADPGSQIVVSAGAIIGLGSVIHACRHSTIRIGSGVHLGAAVLLVGRVCVGDRAVLGMGVTAIDVDIPVGQTLPPGSLLGAMGRTLDPPPAPSPPAAEVTARPPSANPDDPWEDAPRTAVAHQGFSAHFNGNPIAASYPTTPPLPDPTPYQAPAPGGINAGVPRLDSATPGHPDMAAQGVAHRPAGPQDSLSPLGRSEDEPPGPSSSLSLTVTGRLYVDRLRAMMFPQAQLRGGAAEGGGHPDDDD